MKKLILKSLLFFSILALIKLPFVFFYQDELSYRRAKFDEQDFNTIFIGSSRTKYAIIPAYFDLLMEDQKKSYNFGIEAALPPQTFDWCENLIETKPELKLIFFELSGGIDNASVFQEPWTDFSFSDYLKTVTNLSFNQSAKYHDKLAIVLLKPQIFSDSVKIDYNLTLDKLPENYQIKRKVTVSLAELELSRLRNSQIETVITGDAEKINEIYWNRILRLIKIAEAKQIELYFFVPPRLETQTELEMIRPIYQKLPEKYRLKMPHSAELFYLHETSNDNFHLNYRGAKEFTREFAHAVNKRHY